MIHQPLQRTPFQACAFTVMHWAADFQREHFDLNPPYQRGSVWTTAQRQNLIKSLLLGIPVGTVIYNVRDGWDEVYAAIVDGKQRIEALRAFIDNQLAVPTWWFEDADRTVSADGDLTYAQLSLRGRRRIMNLPIPALEAHVGSIAEEAAIFDLINTAGTAQGDSSIAHARAISEGTRP